MRNVSETYRDHVHTPDIRSDEQEETHCPAWLPIIIAIVKLRACFASNVNEECKLPAAMPCSGRGTGHIELHQINRQSQQYPESRT